MPEPYSNGGIIPGAGETVVRVRVGERAITSDGVVYELQETAEGLLWVMIGEGYECWMGTE
jgi:hypothetical protein